MSEDPRKLGLSSLSRGAETGPTNFAGYRQMWLPPAFFRDHLAALLYSIRQVFRKDLGGGLLVDAVQAHWEKLPVVPSARASPERMLIWFC